MEMVCQPAGRGTGRWARRVAASGLVVPLAYGFAGVLTLSMLAGRARPDVALLAALVVHASYRLDALGDLLLEPLASARSRGLARWRGWAVLDGLAAFAAAAGLATALHSTLAAALLAVFPLSVAFYGLPLLGRLGLRWACVKDIPHAKAAYTALFWGVLAVYAGWLCGAGQRHSAGHGRPGLSDAHDRRAHFAGKGSNLVRPSRVHSRVKPPSHRGRLYASDAAGTSWHLEPFLQLGYADIVVG